jgi:hypothetical protein
LKLKIESKYARMPAAKFIKQMLSEWDLSELRYFKLYTSDTDDRTPPQVYGIHRCNVTKYTKEYIRGTCRISLAFKDGKFPVARVGRRGSKVGKRRIEAATGDKNIILVWGAAHELYHYLCRSGQLPYHHKDERTADAFADVYVYKYTKGIGVDR